eukprot:jgi/Tetstr1/421173/TSEL_012215.t1
MASVSTFHDAAGTDDASWEDIMLPRGAREPPPVPRGPPLRYYLTTVLEAPNKVEQWTEEDNAALGNLKALEAKLQQWEAELQRKAADTESAHRKQRAASEAEDIRLAALKEEVARSEAEIAEKQEMLRKKEAAAHEAAEAVRRQREELRECAALMEQPLKAEAEPHVMKRISDLEATLAAREARLNERAQAIESSERQLAGRVRECEQLENELNGRNASLVSREEELEGLQAVIGEERARLDSDASSLTRLTQELQAAQEKLSEATQEQERSEKELSRRGEALAELETIAKQAQGEDVAMQREVDEMRAVLQRQEQQLAAATLELERDQQELSLREEALAEREALVKQMEDKHEAMVLELSEQKALLQSQEQQLSAATAELESSRRELFLRGEALAERETTAKQNKDERDAMEREVDELRALLERQEQQDMAPRERQEAEAAEMSGAQRAGSSPSTSVAGTGNARVREETELRLQRMEQQLAQALEAQRLSEQKAQALEADLQKVSYERTSLQSTLSEANRPPKQDKGLLLPALQRLQEKARPKKNLSWGSNHFSSPEAAVRSQGTPSPELATALAYEDMPERSSSASARRSIESAHAPSAVSGYSTATGSASSSIVPSPCPSDATSNRSANILGTPSAGPGADTIEVVVYSASGLLGSGLKDMFIHLKLGEHRCSTKAKSPSPTAAQGGSLVTWGQTFRMPHYQPLRTLSLRVRLYAKKSMGLKHMVGEAHIHLRELMEAPQSRMHQTWPLSGVVGQVELKLAQL